MMVDFKKKIVADFEYCSRLKALGLPQKETSFFYLKEHHLIIELPYIVEFIGHNTFFKVFGKLTGTFTRALTSEELGSYLPSTIDFNGETLKLIFEWNGKEWITSYVDDEGIKIVSFSDSKESNSRAKMLIWLIEELKYKPEAFKARKAEATVASTFKPVGKFVEEWINGEKAESYIDNLKGISKKTKERIKLKLKILLDMWKLTEKDIVLFKNRNPIWKYHQKDSLKKKAMTLYRKDTRILDMRKTKWVLWVIPLKEPKKEVSAKCLKSLLKTHLKENTIASGM